MITYIGIKRRIISLLNVFVPKTATAATCKAL